MRTVECEQALTRLDADRDNLARLPGSRVTTGIARSLSWAGHTVIGSFS